MLGVAPMDPIAAQKTALRDRLVTARRRHPLTEVGEDARRRSPRTCWRPTRYDGRRPSRRTSRSATSPAPAPARRGAARPGPAGWSCRCCCPTTTWTGRSTRPDAPRPPAGGCSSRPGRGSGSRRRDRGRGAGARRSRWTARGMRLGSAGAAPTTGRSPGSRSARSCARCSTTTSCSTGCRPTTHDRPVTARPTPWSRRPASAAAGTSVSVSSPASSTASREKNHGRVSPSTHRSVWST